MRATAGAARSTAAVMATTPMQTLTALARDSRIVSGASSSTGSRNQPCMVQSGVNTAPNKGAVTTGTTSGTQNNTANTLRHGCDGHKEAASMRRLGRVTSVNTATGSAA